MAALLRTRPMESHSPYVAPDQAEITRRAAEYWALAKLAPTAAAREEFNRRAKRYDKLIAAKTDRAARADWY